METLGNMGATTREEIESFSRDVLEQERFVDYRMEWTTAGSIFIKPIIYIDERWIGNYPWVVKEVVLHEVAHIATWPEDMRHGTIFYREYIRLLGKFLVM